MAVCRTLLVVLLAMVSTTSSTSVTQLPGGGNVEVETSSRGQVCMYITDDWGTVESTQCTSEPGTYTLTRRGGGQARVTITAFGGVSVDTGHFGAPQSGSRFGGGQQQQQSEDEDNSVRFGSYENPRTPAPLLYTTAPPSYVAPRQWQYRRPSPPLRRRPTPAPTIPPVRVPHLANTLRPAFGQQAVQQAPPVTEAGIGSVDIVASGPGQLTVFGHSEPFELDVTGPSAPYSDPDPLVARKKRNRFSAASSLDQATVRRAPARGSRFSSVRAADGSSTLDSHHNGHRLTSVRSSDGSSVLTSDQDGDSVSSVQSADGSSVVTTQTAGGQRLGLVRSPDGSLVFSTYIGGRLVNVVRSSDGSSVVSTNIDGHQVTALTSPTGQRLIAGAGPGHNLDAFFNVVMEQLAKV